MAVSQASVVLVAALALFDRHGRVLLARRPEGKSMAGLWELPGGKIERGERPEQGLCREIHEELGLVVLPEHLTPLAFASHAYAEFHLLMPVWEATRFEGSPSAREGQAAVAWVHGDALDQLDMPPADVPLVPILKARCGAHMSP